jgi:hypothetical protein
LKKKFLSPGTFLLTVLVLGWLLSSCENNSDCSSAEEVTQLQVRFLKAPGRTATNDTDRVFIRSIYAIDFPKTPFYKNSYQNYATVFYLSLNPKADITQFVFDVAYKTESWRDTISVQYQRKYELPSVNCDARINFSQVDTSTGSKKKLIPKPVIPLKIRIHSFSFSQVTANNIDLYAK